MEKYFEMSKAQIIKTIFMIILGSVIYGVSTNLFIIPNKLLGGVISGIGLIIQYLTGMQAGYVILLLNVPLFVLSILKIDRRFTCLTLIGTIALSAALVGLQGLDTILAPIRSEDELLYCIYGGVLNGLGIGIVFSNYGSTGGIDIISMYVRKKYNSDIGNVNFAINFIIVTAGAILFNFKVGLYTLISMYLTSFTIDKVINGFNKQKILFIITEKKEEISDAIMYNLNRGITILHGEGAYTKNKRNILYCVVSLRQVPRVKEYVKSIDRGAFISVLDTTEVFGKGFSSPVA